MRVPDEPGERLAASGEDLPRRALEAFASEEYKRGNLTKPELGNLPGYQTRPAVDGFLQAHGVFEEFTLEDLEQERRDLSRIPAK